MSFNPTFETEKPEMSFHFTPNKRLREMDLEMNINPIFEFVKKNSLPETTQPVVLEKPAFVLSFTFPTKIEFIYNKDHNPFIKKAEPLPSKNINFNACLSGNRFIPILDEPGIKKRDLRFSKILESKINGQTFPVKNFAQLRNRLLAMFYRKVLRQDADVQYCRDGLSIHGVGSKQNILAIINLVKILNFRLKLKLRLRDGQIVVLAVA